MHHWLKPMLPSRYSEAGCFKCHSSEANIKGADKLSYGLSLIEKSGCYGCHAIEKYEASISLNANWPYSHYAMGYCYLASFISSKDQSINKHILNQALNIFNKTISLDGGYLEAYHARAICYQKLGDKKSAMEDFKFCLMIEPGYEPAMNGISELEKIN